jgi:hypothetical protein
MVCATARPLDDQGEWLELDLKISAGHRGPSRWQSQATEVEGLVICPGCYDAPGGGHLRTAIEQRFQAPLELERGCHVTCRGRVRRRTGLVARLVRGDSPLLCPVCFGKAGYVMEDPPARDRGALGRFRPRSRVN